MNEWPPKYTVRHSRRAKRISLSIPQGKGLVLVLPNNVSIDTGLLFLNNHRRWVEKNLSATCQQPDDPTEFPQAIHLPSMQKSWSTRYHHIDVTRKVKLSSYDERLVFSGNMPSFSVCVPSLKHWLRTLACQQLPDWLSQVSQEIQLPYNRVAIRTQKTLWGSCSKEKNISLNDRLLYLPYEVVRYVLVHELCHTVYFNHSPSFWRLVKRFVPNYKQCISEMRRSSFHIPAYMHS
jgi:predicted metal-dependent hydrolase